MKTVQITIAPYQRILRAGCDIAITQLRTVYRVQLKRGEEVLGYADCPRNGNLTTAQALERARLGTWGHKSAMHGIMQKFADLAETTTTTV